MLGWLWPSWTITSLTKSYVRWDESLKNQLRLCGSASNKNFFTMDLKSVPVLSLRQTVMMKIAILVCNDPDIQKFLRGNGGEASVFPNKETQIYLEKAGSEMEQTTILNREETWAWRNIYLEVNYPSPIDFAYIGDKIFIEPRIKTGTLPFERWEELVERKISSLSLPSLLRSEFFDVIRSVAIEIDNWLKDNYCVLSQYLREGRPIFRYFQWNSLGKIDRQKTARTLLTIRGLHYNDYRCVALYYGMMDQLLAIMDWKNPERQVDTSKWRYCAGLLWETSPEKNGLKYFAQPYSLGERIRLEPNFRFQPNEEQNVRYINYVMSKNYILYEDLLFCLSQISDDEKETIFKEHPFKILMYFLDWPLQCEFLLAAKRLLTYLTANDFRDILIVILYERIMLDRKDFDYINLLKEFWSIIPPQFKQSLKTDSIYKGLMYTINFPVDEIFRHEKLFEHFSGRSLTFGYRGVKYMLIRIEESSKGFEALDTMPFASFRNYKFCSIFYVCKMRKQKPLQRLEQELKNKIKQKVPEFISKLRDLCDWPYKRT
ncbi:uncharacterized protein NPIL_283151 [Nephila pilipes]|uniref:Uncharacterized protein n=1 Tax=Nephila pilipes TaxID=299642 RepID=A0A8X6U3E0_NEPPI|nr:uncharacterized protein NPIL_283151 [Nephila pilipes]